MSIDKNDITLIGVGNEFRQDDAVGLVILRHLREQFPNTIEASGEGTALIEYWQNKNIVYLFDAVRSGAQSGTIHRIEAHQQCVPSQFFHYSTHAFSVAEAVELARTLNQLPNQLILYGVEGEVFSIGIGLSALVEQAAADVVKRVVGELENCYA
jgi:hydrogenase maturation protease